MTREEAINGLEMFKAAALWSGNRRVYSALSMAISALREHEERSKACPCCELSTIGLTNKQIENGWTRSDFIQNVGGYYIIRWKDGLHTMVSDADDEGIDIKFCPVCGRRLEEV